MIARAAGSAIRGNSVRICWRESSCACMRMLVFVSVCMRVCVCMHVSAWWMRVCSMVDVCTNDQHVRMSDERKGGR
jgi:hypothetical protein